MRVGLVLGAGGIIGGAWLAGGLRALERHTGWDPGDADLIVGTSAGSIMGAFCAAGSPPWRDGGSTGWTGDDPLADTGERAGRQDGSHGTSFTLHAGLPRLGPASPRLVLSGLRNLDRRTPSAVAAGLGVEGFVSTRPLEAMVRRVAPDGWPERPELWIVACDYETGERVAFGREGSPPAELPDAVAASCAIPSFYRPKTIAGRRFVDGGLWSTSNLDMVADQGLDLAVCLNPTSSLHPARAFNPVARLAAAVRSLSGRRLGSEAKALLASGTKLVLVQPVAEDLAVMPSNMMSRRRRRQVYEVAQETVAEQLAAPGNRILLEGLRRSRADAGPGEAADGEPA